jgi:hypothetical protein
MPAFLISSRRLTGAELHVRIANQQHLAADLAREGNVEGARAARAKLYVLLNQADLLDIAS